VSSELRELLGPFELLDLGDREHVVLRIVSSELGSMVIHPKWPGAPSEKRIPVLRVHLAEGVKPYPPMYFDITSKTLIAQLQPFLLERDFERYDFTITKFGVPPRARFTLARQPR